jgi:hypothetical protein
MLVSSRQSLFRASRVRLSGGDDVKPRWTLPSKDYLKYTYQPSIPDKHFMGAHWNYAPATMWLRHYRPLMEEIAQAGYKTASSWVKCITRPIARTAQAHIPGIGHKIIAALAMWATFSYVARSTYGEKMEAWALLDKLHSYAQGHNLGSEGFWDTEEMDAERRHKAAEETADRLEKLWQTSIAEATNARSFQVLCNKLAVTEVDENRLMTVPEPVSWRFGMIPFDSIDAHTFPDSDRKDIAVEVKPLHERPHVHHEPAGHGKLTAKNAKEIYESATSVTAGAAH